MIEDLRIYYDSLDSPDLITSDCLRWDVQDYSVVIETELTKSQLSTLRDNITPGATDQLYNILGKPTYYDKTWTGSNTIRLSTANSHLQYMRDDRILYVKNISDTPKGAGSKKLLVKLECYISGSIL